MRVLFIVFIVVPLVEMLVLIEVGSKIGTLTTILLVILTATIGMGLLRQQGLSTLFRARSRWQHGELPGQEIIEGLLLAVGGALLITPGFITDAVGFFILIPYTRIWLIKKLMQSSSFRAHFSPMDSGKEYSSQNGNVLEGEFRRKNETDTHRFDPSDKSAD